MDTYQKIIALQRALMQDYKNPSNNEKYSNVLQETIEALKKLQKFY